MEVKREGSENDRGRQVLIICTACQRRELRKNPELLKTLIGDANVVHYSTKLECFYDAAKLASEKDIGIIYTTGWINWLGGSDVELPEKVIKEAQKRYGLGNLTPIKMDFV
jgi:hypothetical protein